MEDSRDILEFNPEGDIVIGCKDKCVQRIVIPFGVTSIAYQAFSGCKNLASIEIPESVTNIADNAFEGCTSLPVINALRYADSFVIEAIDKSLSTYILKDKTKFIGSSAFKDCTSLTSIEIPNSVTQIGSYAFRYCTSLTSIEIPNSVTSIGEYNQEIKGVTNVEVIPVSA